jgi:hypothetical protein
MTTGIGGCLFLPKIFVSAILLNRLNEKYEVKMDSEELIDTELDLNSEEE